jgi:hypothetical protein
MNWLDKAIKLKNLFDKSPIDIDVFFRQSKWLPGEINEIKKQYPFLSDSYIDFIKKYDETSIGGLRLRGSKGYKISLQKQIYNYQEILKDEYFPFGDDFGGNIYLFDKKGEVLFWDKNDYDFEKPEILASSFDEFMDKFLLGKSNGTFGWISSDKLRETLQHQGWV